jgi:RNA polymerase sigma factor (sigma-70 family)
MPTHTLPRVDVPSRAEALPVLGDAPLLAAARVGDDHAVAELYSRHHTALARMARRRAFPDYSPQDLVSEAFAKMLEALRDGQGPDDNALAYLATTIRNLSIAHGRRRSHRHAPTLAADETMLAVPDPRPDVDHGVLTEEFHSDMQAALSSLPSNWREVLLLTHVDELSVAEASDRLGTTPTAFRALSYRARRALLSAYSAHTQTHLPLEGG